MRPSSPGQSRHEAPRGPTASPSARGWRSSASPRTGRELTSDVDEPSLRARKRTSLSKTVLLLGATGLVGSHCLRLLASDAAFARVVVLTRRSLPRELAQEKVEAHVVDFDNLAAHADVFRVDQIISALGTTIRKVGGDREAFRRVDYA